MKRWPIVAAALLVLAAGAWVWGSPYLTASRLQKAAEAGDLDAISAKVDFPAVRESLKTQLHARLDRSKATGLEGLGALLASRLADPVVDAAVTPEGMRAMIGGAALAQSGQPRAAAVAPRKMVLRRESLGRFALVPERGDGPSVVFELRGLAWRVTAVRLPKRGLL